MIGERLGWLLLGCMIGFVLGYIVRSLGEIKEELDEVDAIVRNEPVPTTKKRLRRPTLQGVALFVVVALTAWASFQSARVNTQLNHTTDCLTQYNTSQGKALNSRDDAIREGTDSEIGLWTKYKELYKKAKSNPKEIPALQDELNQNITKHRNALIETQAIRSAFPYSEPDVLANCKSN